MILGADITAGIEMDDCEYLEIDGLDAQRFMISGIAGVGIRATACDHVAVRRVTVEWTAQSGMLFTNAGDRTCPNTGLLVEGCVVQHTNLGSIPAGGSECSALDFGTEAISIENHDGFEVRCCQVSNSFAGGIGFGAGSLHGSVHHNLVELARTHGIAAQEGYFAEVYMNVVRYVGYYQLVEGSQTRFVEAASWLLVQTIKKLGVACNFASRSAGILVANGGLHCQNESGTASNLRIEQNEVYWTVGASIAVTNRWRLWRTLGVKYPCTLPQWPPDDGEVFGIEILHNVCHKAQQGTQPIGIGEAAVELDGAMSASQVKNNMIVGTGVNATAGLAVIAAPSAPWANLIASNYYFDNGPGGQTPADPAWATGREAVFGVADPFQGVPMQIGDQGDFRLLPHDPTTAARGTWSVDYAPGYDPGPGPVWNKRRAPDVGAHPAIPLLSAGAVDWVAGTGCLGLPCVPSLAAPASAIGALPAPAAVV